MTTDERDPDAIFEPWQPTVGQRVRVRLSPECPLRDHWNAGDDPHPDEIGDVMMIADDVLHPRTGHDYLVMADQQADGAYRRGGWYAAIELEPLDGGPDRKAVPFVWRLDPIR